MAQSLDVAIPVPLGKDYHCLFCCSHGDNEAVSNYIDTLEIKGYRCASFDRDALPYLQEPSAFDQLIPRCTWFVIVVTRELLKSEDVMFQVNVIVHQVSLTGIQNVILLLFEEGIKDLMSYSLLSLEIIDAKKDGWLPKLESLLRSSPCNISAANICGNKGHIEYTELLQKGFQATRFTLSGDLREEPIIPKAKEADFMLYLKREELKKASFEFLPEAPIHQNLQHGSAEVADKYQNSDHPDVADLGCLKELIRNVNIEDVTQCTFARFAAKHFQANATHTYIDGPLMRPLLALSKTDESYALAVWNAIMQYLNSGSSQKDQETEYGEKSDLLLDVSESKLEKIGFIIQQGITKWKLRDEIYSQICKQLIGNPNSESLHRGWTLLGLCLGSFPPTKKLLKYLLNFIRNEHPEQDADYMEQRLQRMSSNGPRKLPPSCWEIEAVETRQPMLIRVCLMDGTYENLTVDSSSTSQELCQKLAERINLRYQFGFSLSIFCFDVAYSLGCGCEKVMDVISHFEQLAKKQSVKERDAPWRLFYQKDIFAPFHDPGDDSVAINLIYQQVVVGIKEGLCTFNKDEELARIAAQTYFLRFGIQYEAAHAQTILPAILPASCLKNSTDLETWMSIVCKELKSSYFTRQQVTESRVKKDIVNFAKHTWTMLFSRLYEAFRVSGPRLPKDQVVIAINSLALQIITDHVNVVLELQLSNIASISSSSEKTINDKYVFLATTKGDKYTFLTPHADDMAELVLNLKRLQMV